MGEAGGVEVDAQIVLLGELHPRNEEAILQLVAIHPLALAEDGVGGVEIDALFAGNQGGGLQEVGLQLLEVAGASGIVAGDRQTVAGLGVLLVEAGHVVAAIAASTSIPMRA